jgi:hypothetical protein
MSADSLPPSAVVQPLSGVRSQAPMPHRLSASTGIAVDTAIAEVPQVRQGHSVCVIAPRLAQSHHHALALPWHRVRRTYPLAG